MSATRIAVIDAHPLYRFGVVHLLSKVSGLELVAEGAGADDAFRIARQYAPDILILDLHAVFSVETVAWLSGEFPAIRTLILTLQAHENQVLAALRAGAAGYMLKGASGAELIESIRRVQRGESCVYPSLADRLTRVAVHCQAKPDRFSGLTAREEQILDCLARGLSNKEIGRELELSEGTIKNYVSTLLEKLHVRNRVEAALLGKSRLSSGREA